MSRLLVCSLAAVASTALVAACGGDDDEALDTLPPIRTTTSTSTTTTTPDERRKFYEVKPGDNLAEIARSFQVPPGEIVRINQLPDNGEILQIGQVLEIPTDVVLVEELPTPSTDASDTTEAP